MEKNFIKFSEKLKKELQRLYKKGAFDSLIKIIGAEHSYKEMADGSFEIHLFSVNIKKDDMRKMIPLCFLGPSQTMDGKYCGIHFGIVPKLSRNIEVTLKVTERRRKKRDRTESRSTPLTNNENER